MFANKNLQEKHVPKAHAKRNLATDFILTLKWENGENAKNIACNVNHGVKTSLRHWMIVNLDVGQGQKDDLLAILTKSFTYVPY